jgi:hypothetical protein
VARQAGMALLVVMFTRRRADGANPGDEGLDMQHVCAESGPVWIRPGDMCAIQSWYSGLRKWATATSDLQTCIVVRDPVLVANTLPYLHDNCPTVVIAWKLKRLKWVESQRRTVHDRNVIGVFDAYPAVKMKTYLQVLLTLQSCLLLTSRVPSRQPILFYRLLLLGRRIEPDLGNVHYVKAWAALAAQGITPVLPIEPPSDSDLPVPVEDVGADDDVLMPSRPPPEAKKRRATDAPPVAGAQAGAVAGLPRCHRRPSPPYLL